MKKAILFALALVAVSNAGHWQCYAVNDAGYSFWGTGYNQGIASQNALNTCRYNTPSYGTCWVTSTCNWIY